MCYDDFLSWLLNEKKLSSRYCQIERQCGICRKINVHQIATSKSSESLG